MAQKVHVELTDDLDGSAASETITFALDGKSYEIDLSTANADEFRQVLTDYVNAGRRPTGGATPKRSITAAEKQNAYAIRAWAADNGHQVADRGRIPRTVVEAYQAANSQG